MGIPSYYSYIIKNHPNIFKRLSKNLKFEYLYLDSNSIIYDSIKLVDYTTDTDLFETTLIDKVYHKILQYIELFNNPTNVVVAFDGVAPFAKLEQQRTRRYKSQYIDPIIAKIHKDNTPKWSTAAITPGTQFMNKLNTTLNGKFSTNKNILYMGSDTPGEGEHKLFQHLRESKINLDSNILVYGLDADLIMLGLNHLTYCRNIFLYRETPTYINSLNNALDKEDDYVLELSTLGEAIIYNMTDSYNKEKMYDYIFLGLMLGNDFMPHFPAINIRTNGIDILLNHYSSTIKNDEIIFNGKEINWKLFRKLIQSLADNEYDYLTEEYKQRSRLEKRQLPTKTPKEKENKLMSMPIYERQVEKYINPKCNMWENRYYKTLFNTYITDVKLKAICKNYLEGLEWNCLYYTSGCPDWNWKYKYHYPPLLTDLIKHIPYFNTRFIKNKNPDPLPELVQLAYVLPRSKLHLLPFTLYEKVKNKNWYSDDLEFKWSFCKYLWEAHIVFEVININELKKLVGSNISF